MKFKSLLFVGCLGLFSAAFADDNRHVHPQANNNKEAKAATKSPRMPGYCEIEIVNYSYDDVIVSGLFDDNTAMKPFTVYSYGPPEYVDLYYHDYCHPGMRLFINSYRGYNVFSSYVGVGNTVTVYPSVNLANKLSVKIQAK